MRLRDKIETVGLEPALTFKAHVWYRSMASALNEHQNDGQTFVYWDLTQQLAAIVPPGHDWQVQDELRWRGKRYRVVQVATRRKGNKDHHTTLYLENIEL